MNKRSRIYAVVATAILLTGAVSALADKGQNNETRLKTRLTGAPISGKTPEGNVDFRSAAKGRMRLNVEVEQVNLPDGTVLTVALTHAGLSANIGTITLLGGSGELELDSQDGDVVPTVQSGDMVSVNNGTKAILAGVF